MGPVGFLIAATVLLAACAPLPPRDFSAGRESSPPAAPKTLTLGVLREPPGLAWGLTGGLLSSESGIANLPPLVHEDLVVEAEIGLFQPRLAVSLPSVDDGSWRLNSDGTMET